MKREETFWSWLWSVRLSRLLLVLVPCLLITPAITYWLLTTSIENSFREGIDSADTARKVLGLIDFDHLSGPELRSRIDELLRIKNSVQTELRSLEKKRQVMLQDLSDFTRKIEAIKLETGKEAKELEKIKFSIVQTKLLEAELIQRNTPDIHPPLPLLPSQLHFRVLPNPTKSNSSSCSMETCFDYSRCSISSGMPVYLYPAAKGEESEVTRRVAELRSLLAEAGQLVTDPHQACIYLLVTDSFDRNTPNTLSHWQGDGHNHVIINLSASSTHSAAGAETGRALLIQPAWRLSDWRAGFDLVLPPLVGGSQSQAGTAGEEPIWRHYPSLVPIAREYLLIFEGDEAMLPDSLNDAAAESALRDSRAQNQQVVDHLNRMARGNTRDKFLFRFQCEEGKSDGGDGNGGNGGGGGEKLQLEAVSTDWRLCGTEAERLERLRKATFSLVLGPGDRSLVSTGQFQQRLFEALRTGSIPVILGSDLILPLDEVLDWTQFSIVLPRPRITELHYLIRSLPYTDLFNMKRQGRLVFENYLQNSRSVLRSLLANLRTRLLIPAPPVKSFPSTSVFNASFTPLLMDQLPSEVEPEENLGPLESPFPSPAFKRNYSSLLLLTSDSWNRHFHPTALFPQTPWEPLLPTEAKFLNSGNGFRPICGGEGGSGKEFSQALGGNTPQEQFTVVMLTYEREAVLMSSLSRLYALPYLNKVLVVWNSPRDPDPQLRWPDIGVPIHVVRGAGNSLNNRFLPFADIQTEAVLSVDDDSHLRHDEIIFGFRVWRENRDRIVGFPGRFHAWDRNNTAWNYNSNYSCELSMVLTGAAFYHNYYNYLYSQYMPAIIRTTVDELMNCEDLAMNFLVSHVTRQPPVKVTSRWTFRCPGCPVSLSEDDSHFQERHHCMNLFSEVYGYNPLLYTQYRADSVLFKTRIPPEKQKCFKFI